jgi:hypothetical protein
VEAIGKLTSLQVLRVGAVCEGKRPHRPRGSHISRGA